MFGFLGLAGAAIIVHLVLTVLLRRSNLFYKLLGGLNILYFLLLVWLMWGSLPRHSFTHCFLSYFKILYYWFTHLHLPAM